MLQLEKIVPERESHEEIFLARYRRLRVWALQLTDNNRSRAEDLLHDAYIQFTFARIDLNKIHNLDGYLYSMLRNLYLSEIRRTLRLKSRTLSIIDYDSSEIGLRGIDPRDQLRLQDELRQVCQYACLRKETSKAGSVLILRFLHGYYPREIAQVMRSSREAVEERLRVARSEAKLYLENPKSLRFMREAKLKSSKETTQSKLALATDELSRDLRHTIFAAREGECLTDARLKNLYRKEETAGIETATLAHVVSCAQCLDEVNRLLDLPLLVERFPTDTLGADRGGRGNGDDGSSSDGGDNPPGGAASENEARQCRHRAQEVFEHHPQELCIAVNGRLAAAQKINAASSEQTLKLNVSEKIDFVEVVSEQEVRLLFLVVDEWSQNASHHLSTQARLSDDRTLRATLTFDDAGMEVQVVYHDPLMNHTQSDVLEEVSAPLEMASECSIGEREESSSRTKDARGFADVWERGRGALGGFRAWLRPGAVTAAFAVFLIGIALLAQMRLRATSAAELLRRSIVAAETTAAAPDRVLHRTIILEERAADENYLIARRRIEVWQGAGGEGQMRRVYDERNDLVAGERVAAGGASTIYYRGATPQERGAQAGRAKASFESGDLWRLDPSGKDFSALVGEVDKVTVEEKSGTYRFNYRNEFATDAPKLLRAMLVLDKNDLRALEQTLIVQPLEGSGARIYKFTVSRYEKLPAKDVAPSVFQPDAELLNMARAGEGESQRAKGDAPAAAASYASPRSTATAASPELEIEATYLLNRIKANLGEQVTMTRTPEGALRVEAILETAERKAEMLGALAPLTNNPSIIIDVSTVAEALKRRRAVGATPKRATTREVEVTTGSIPADAELRRYFSARLSGSAAIDKEIERFASRAMSRSRAALLHAAALKRLVERFTPEEIRALEPQAKAKWLSMIREHAESYRREANGLRQDLRSVFQQSAASEAGSGNVNEANVVQSAARLLQLSYEQDAAVRSAFALTADDGTTVGIKSQAFWRSLAAAEKLSVSIQAVYQNRKE